MRKHKGTIRSFRRVVGDFQNVYSLPTLCTQVFTRVLQRWTNKNKNTARLELARSFFSKRIARCKDGLCF